MNVLILKGKGKKSKDKSFKIKDKVWFFLFSYWKLKIILVSGFGL